MKQKNQFWLAVAVVALAWYFIHSRITAPVTSTAATTSNIPGVLSFDPSEISNL